MSAMTIFYICLGVFCVGQLVYVIWLDRQPARERARRRRELPRRIAEARQQIRQLFRESERRMDRMAGRRDDFHFGPWNEW